VNNTDLYDIASVTKIAATTLALMKLYEENKIDIRKKASRYWPALKKTNKKNLLISDILTHQAGLKAWLPVWKGMMEKGKPNYNIFHPEKDVNYSVRVADSMFILQSQIEKIWKTILESETGEPGKYVYSDIGMLIMQRVIEEVTEMPMEEYLAQNFYEPLGLHRLLFRPLDKFELEQIVPTECDTQFRMQLVHGYVHDPVAALLGGVGGNAGLFSDANSLAIIMQMLVNGGTYGGHRYFKESTVNLFTGRYNTHGMNRRGLGFDKPDLIKTENGPTAVSAPHQAFGHSGFTGTAAWADPVNDLVYVFLSNRIYPSASNNKLVTGNIRTNIMEAVYNIILRHETAGR
jgi:CubicO group peptidase (beta-lactamase class C family)